MSHSLPRRVLICGLGSIGRRYCRVINKTWPSIQLAAVRSGHGGQVPEEENLQQCFYSIDAALAWEPEAAVIASPANLHIEQACQLAKNSIPLLIEKPIGTGFESPSFYDQLTKCSQLAPIYVGYVLRHDPCATFLREQIQTGRLGKLMSADFVCGSWLPDWRVGQDYKKTVSARRELGGGALLELSHEIDMAYWLLGPLTPVRAFLCNSGILDIDVEDQTHLLAQNLEGSLVSIRLDFCTQPARRIITLRYSHGELRWNLLDGIVSSSIDGSTNQVYQLGASSDERFCQQLELFWQYPRPGESVMCSFEEGLKVLDLVTKTRHLATQDRQ